MAVRRTGRRPGDSGTREQILAAASSQFARQGYDRATMRSIANEAGVDAKLIAHYFGNKQRLFVEAVGLPINPAQLLPSMLASDPAKLRDRITTVIEGVLTDPDSHQKMAGIVRAAATEPEAARMVREFLTREVFTPTAQQLSVDRPELRMNLIGSQLVGLIMARFVVGIEPLASAPAREVASIVAETFRRYLVEPLPEA